MLRDWRVWFLWRSGCPEIFSGIYDCASSLTGDEPGLRSRGVGAYEAGEDFAAVEKRAAAICGFRAKWNGVGGESVNV